MKQNLKRAFLLVLVFLTVVSAAGLPVYAEDEESSLIVTSNLVVMSCRVTNSAGKTVSRVAKNDVVNIELMLKNTGFKTEQIGTAWSIDVSKLVDSFTGNTTPSVVVTSSPSQPLTFKVTFSGLTYNGIGKSLLFVVGYALLDLSYDPVDVTINECEEYTPPETTGAAAIPMPTVQFTRSQINNPLNPGEEKTITVYVKNRGKTAMTSVVISFALPEGLMFTGGNISFPMQDIAAGATGSINIKLKAEDEIAASSQSLNVELKFNYDSGGDIAPGTASDLLLIPCKKSEKTTDSTESNKADSAVPNIIISSFSYGGNPIPTGEVFALSLTFFNTSKNLKIENIIMTIETGESFAIASASNTAFFPSLNPGQSLSEAIDLQALPSAQTGAQAVEINFKYEYVDGSTRESKEVSEKLSIPIYQPDRFEITADNLPEMAYIGDEISMVLNYVNKGKGEIANVEASIVGIDSPVPLQNLGNIEPGKSDYISFLASPMEAGEVSFVLKVTYEDANGELQTREFPVTLMVEEPMLDFDGEGEEFMPEPAPSKWKTALWIAGGALALGLVVLFAVLRIRKRKAEKKNEYAFDWDETPQSAIVAEGADLPEADEINSKG